MDPLPWICAGIVVVAIVRVTVKLLAKPLSTRPEAADGQGTPGRGEAEILVQPVYSDAQIKTEKSADRRIRREPSTPGLDR